MLRNFLINRKAQNTMEYALLIALVGAGVVAMTLGTQRALQARQHDAAQFMTAQTSTIGNSTQYEPYYQNSDYTSQRNSVDNKRLGRGLVGYDSESNSVRTGGESSSYSTNDVNTTQ